MLWRKFNGDLIELPISREVENAIRGSIAPGAATLDKSAAVDDPDGRATDEWSFAVIARVLTLRIAGADGSRPWQATRYEHVVGDPIGRLTAGRRIHEPRRGNPDIYVMRCELNTVTCSEPRQLTRPRQWMRIRPGRRRPLDLFLLSRTGI